MYAWHVLVSNYLKECNNKQIKEINNQKYLNVSTLEFFVCTIKLELKLKTRCRLGFELKLEKQNRNEIRKKGIPTLGQNWLAHRGPTDSRAVVHAFTDARASGPVSPSRAHAFRRAIACGYTWSAATP